MTPQDPVETSSLVETPHKDRLGAGTRVEKFGGRYGGPGRIVGQTDDLGDGYVLYNVAMKVEGGYGEFVHVFPASVLRLAPAATHPTATRIEQLERQLAGVEATRDAARDNFLTMQGTAAQLLKRAEAAERQLATARKAALEEAAKVVAEYIAAVSQANEEGRAVLTAAGLRTSETSRRADLLAVISEDLPETIRSLLTPEGGNNG